MAKIIDCKVIRDETLKFLKNLPKNEIVEFIRVGNDKASEVYVKNKNNLFNQLGIPTKTTVMNDDCSESNLIRYISSCSTYTLVQLPLPKQINERNIMNKIPKMLDIDCQNNYNLGDMMSGYNKYKILPCTVWGILRVIREFYKEQYPIIRPEKFGDLNMDCVRGKTITVIGRSNIVGKPAILSLINCGATVIECNSKTSPDDIKKYSKNSDIIILAVGKPKIFNHTYFSSDKEQLIIDVGINVIGNTESGKRKIVGDLDPSLLSDNVTYTPVPNGIGILTVLGLLINYFKLEEEKKYGKEN